MEAMENTASNNKTIIRTGIFLPVDIGRDFNSDFLDEEICRRWILTTIHGENEMHCPECRSVLAGKSLQRFWEGKRISCRTCGKYFTALTGSFLSGCHMSLREVILFAMLLHFQISVREIARILRISLDTVHLWEKKFRGIARIKMMGETEPGQFILVDGEKGI